MNKFKLNKRYEPFYFCALVGLASDSKDCILWPYSQRESGYGRFKYKGKEFLAHRTALIFRTQGALNDMACHKCRNRNCINPSHLYWGDAKSNSVDCFNDGNHLIGEESYNAKLNKLDVAKIRELNLNQKEIALMFNISRSHVSRIKNKQVWKHLK